MSKLSKSLQGLEALVFTLMVPYGESLQNEAVIDPQKYNWITGHLSDIGTAGAVTAAILLLSNRANDLKDTLTIATGISLLDLAAALHPKINYEWQDTACFYGTALFAYAAKKFFDKYC
ncbi:MAG TPA: hypothetical protein VI564_00425 [Candidatus Nanoarchaeia archaeon]|nr:hypothetical protein [Candidatus Nanoarchaeia archaeon]